MDFLQADIKKIQTKMIDMIKKDPDVQEENDFHKNFSSGKR